MRCSTIAAILSCASATIAQGVTGQLGDAPVTQDNPDSPTYIANFNKAGDVQGYVSFQGNSNGTGVMVKVSLSDFPAAGGPFPYHVHQFALAADGNCTSAGAHLDPYQRGEKPPCNATDPQTCQVGDLSGKHGKVPADQGSSTYTTEYTDYYLSTTPGSTSFIGNVSVVIHLNNTMRIACANVTVENQATPTSPGQVGGNGTNTPIPTVYSPLPSASGTTTPPPPATNVAALKAVSQGAMAVVLLVGGIMFAL